MVLMVTMTIERPMALLYSMISGRKPMVIMVVPKPRALWTQDPERITIMTNRIADIDIVNSLRQMKNSSDIVALFVAIMNDFPLEAKNSEEIK